MTKEETVELMAILKAAYPNSYNGMTKQEALGVITVWHLHFAEVPADIVFMALQKAISSSKFPPTISEVKTKLEAVYWEAHEALNAYLVPPPPNAREAYRRICNATQAYKMSRATEPTVERMLTYTSLAGNGLAEGQARIGGG